jgi:hypothetical protein
VVYKLFTLVKYLSSLQLATEILKREDWFVNGFDVWLFLVDLLKTQNYWVCGLCPSFGILETR